MICLFKPYRGRFKISHVIVGCRVINHQLAKRERDYVYRVTYYLVNII